MRLFLDSVSEFAIGASYKIDSHLGGVFTVRYFGTSVTGKHLFNITNEGWEKTLMYTDGEALRAVFIG